MTDPLTQIQHYILDEHNQPIPVDVMTWGKWFSTHDRTLKLSAPLPFAPWDPNAFTVSTIFMGLVDGVSSASMFETGVFIGKIKGEGIKPGMVEDRRADTLEEALAHHEQLYKKYLKQFLKRLAAQAKEDDASSGA